jgi:hypothetical protein
MGGAIAILVIEALQGNDIILSTAAQAAIHTVIQGLVAFVVMWFTPPAGWQGNYGKEAAAILFLVVTSATLTACSMLPGQSQVTPQTPKQQLFAAEVSATGAFNIARNLVQTGIIKGDDLMTLDEMQKNVGTSLDAARQVIQQGGSGSSQLQLANAALTKLISYLEQRQDGKSTSGLTSPERPAGLIYRSAGCFEEDLGYA